MQIDIKASNFSLTKSLRRHVEGRLRGNLTFYDENILRTIVRLSDINGPRGGADKCCHCHVVLAGLPDVVVEDIEADLYLAIGRAANRAGRTVRRRLARKRDISRASCLQDTASTTKNHYHTASTTGDNSE